MSSLTGFAETAGQEDVDELQDQITDANDLATLQRQRVDNILSTEGAFVFDGVTDDQYPINVLQADAVGTNNIADDAVTGAKIDDGTIRVTHINASDRASSAAVSYTHLTLPTN